MKKFFFFLLIVLAIGAGIYFALPDTSVDTTYLPIDTKEAERSPSYFSNSLWNQKIPANPAIHEKTVPMNRLLSAVATSDNGATLTYKQWTVPVYQATADTRLQDVPLLIDWTPKNNMVLKNVPVAPYMTPDIGRGGLLDALNPADFAELQLGDAHIAIIDAAQENIYELWQARWEDDQLVASWGNKISLNSNGIYSCGLSSRGSGASLTPGLIWPQELEAGEINHKIFFAFNVNNNGGPVAPFSESDGDHSPEEAIQAFHDLGGQDDNVYPIPEGTIFQLDPSLDLENFVVEDTINGGERPLNRYEKVIAKALQEYGMVNIDNAGTLTLYAVAPQSFHEDPYPALFGTDSEYISIPAELFARMRALDSGPLLGNVEAGLTENQWMNYSCGGNNCEPSEEEICKR